MRADTKNSCPSKLNNKFVKDRPLSIRNALSRTDACFEIEADACGEIVPDVTNTADKVTDNVASLGASKTMTTYGKGMGASKCETNKHSKINKLAKS